MDEKRFQILIVDDYHGNLEFLNAALRDNYDIVLAKDGVQALRIIDKNHPDLILLDIIMPNMDGYEVCTRLKGDNNTSDIPVIFLTGLDNQLDKSRGFNLGAVDYITKPFNIVEVMARVKNQLLINQARALLEAQNKELESEVNLRTEQLDKARESLEATEDKFRILFQRSVNAIAFCNPILNSAGDLIDFTYQDVNVNYERMAFMIREEIVGRKESEVFHPVGPTWLDNLKDTVKNNVDSLFEFYHHGMDKYLLGTSFNITPDGKTFALVLSDVTERTLYQNQLIQAKEKAVESDRLKSAFLTNISHEIRTPLNGIIGFSQLMKQDNITSGTKEHYIRIIEKCSHNLISVIDEIIEFSHMESSSASLNYTRINLNLFLNNRLSVLQEERNRLGKNHIEIESRYPLERGEDFFITDRDRLKKVIDSLLSNALKFTDKGSIQLGYSINKAKKQLIFYVKDTGRGISPQKKQLIFRSFRQAEEGYSREYGGIGLGLAISKKIIGQLGGEIDVLSRQGKGSSFTVVLPYRKDFSDESSDRPTENSEILRDKWGLILDKNKYSAESLYRLLKLKEMNWIIASDLDEARRFCRDYPEIDVVLVNKDSVESPDQVPEVINSFHRAIGCILIGDSEMDKEILTNKGYREIVMRPIEPALLYKALINCFDDE